MPRKIIGQARAIASPIKAVGSQLAHLKESGGIVQVDAKDFQQVGTLDEILEIGRRPEIAVVPPVRIEVKERIDYAPQGIVGIPESDPLDFTHSNSYAPEIKEQMRRWRGDILNFANRGFGLDIGEQQAQPLIEFQKPGSRVAVKSGHGVGKTTDMALSAIWHTWLFPRARTAATAPSAAQLNDALLGEIAALLMRAHPFIRNTLRLKESRLEVVGLEKVQFMTARTSKPNDPSALQGLHAPYMAFLIDECFGVHDKVIEVAKGSMTGFQSRALACGNPTKTSGYWWNAFHKNSHIWKGLTLNAEESPLVSRESIEEWIAEYGKDSDEYRVRVLGQFPRAAINQLISREAAEAASGRQIEKHKYDFAPIILGVDCAGEGDDRNAIFLRQGLRSELLWQGRNVDTFTLGGLVNQYWEEHKADAVFVDVTGGYGSGPRDYLRQLGRDPIGVNFGSASTDPQCRLKRTQMWWKMRKWIEDGGCLPPLEEVVEDLCGPTYTTLATGEKYLEQKKFMKKRGLKSPDLGDALALTFAEDVVKSMKPMGLQEDGEPFHAVMDYDVLEMD